MFVHSEGKYAESYFSALKSERDKIEQDLQKYCQSIEPLEWQPPAEIPAGQPQRRFGGAARVTVRRSADINDRNKWPEYLEWLRTRLEAFYRVFQPRFNVISKDLAEQEDSDGLDESADSSPTGSA